MSIAIVASVGFSLNFLWASSIALFIPPIILYEFAILSVTVYSCLSLVGMDHQLCGPIATGSVGQWMLAQRTTTPTWGLIKIAPSMKWSAAMQSFTEIPRLKFAL